MARFQELDSAQGKGKVVMDDRSVVMVHREPSLFLGIPMWKGGGCTAESGNALARMLQRKADAAAKSKKSKPKKGWWQ